MTRPLIYIPPPLRDLQYAMVQLLKPFLVYGSMNLRCSIEFMTQINWPRVPTYRSHYSTLFQLIDRSAYTFRWLSNPFNVLQENIATLTSNGNILRVVYVAANNSSTNIAFSAYYWTSSAVIGGVEVPFIPPSQQETEDDYNVDYSDEEWTNGPRMYHS